MDPEHVHKLDVGHRLFTQHSVAVPPTYSSVN